MKIQKGMEALIGHTPTVELAKIEKALDLHAALLAKVEFQNPTGSVKDRAALFMIEEAEKSGKLDSETVIIEPTSGNTGIGLAAIAAAKGYRCIIVMPDTMSKERIQLMQAYGAEVVLSDGKLGMGGAIQKADALAREQKAFIPMQFENPANALAHYRTTAPELWEDTDGKIDAFVAGIGTGGTLCGTAKFLKEKNPNIQIIGVEPASSPLISGGVSGPHKLQGIGANFIPKLYDGSLVDRILTVEDEEAYRFARLLAQKEGLFAGITAGAALAAGVRLAREDAYKGKNIVILLPDSGSRYLSCEGFIQ